MVQYTININERTKEGKFFLNLIKDYLEHFDAVEVMKTPNKTTLTALENIEKGEKTVLNSKKELENFLSNI